VQSSVVHYSDQYKMGGFLELENANIKWCLSLDSKDLPPKTIEEKKTTYRSITVDGEEIHFSEGFTDLHTKVYEEHLQETGLELKTPGGQLFWPIISGQILLDLIRRTCIL